MGRIETQSVGISSELLAKNHSTIENQTTHLVMKRIESIIDKLGMVNEFMAERLSPILTPELPSCPSTEIDDLSQGSQFFGELLQKLQVIEDRIGDIETTVNRIEV